MTDSFAGSWWSAITVALLAYRPASCWLAGQTVVPDTLLESFFLSFTTYTESSADEVVCLFAALKLTARDSTNMDPTSTRTVCSLSGWLHVRRLAVVDSADMNKGKSPTITLVVGDSRRLRLHSFTRRGPPLVHTAPIFPLPLEP